jgi:hypothetical protein
MPALKRCESEKRQNRGQLKADAPDGTNQLIFSASTDALPASRTTSCVLGAWCLALNVAIDNTEIHLSPVRLKNRRLRSLPYLCVVGNKGCLLQGVLPCDKRLMNVPYLPKQGQTQILQILILCLVNDLLNCLSLWINDSTLLANRALLPSGPWTLAYPHLSQSLLRTGWPAVKPALTCFPVMTP